MRVAILAIRTFYLLPGIMSYDLARSSNYNGSSYNGSSSTGYSSGRSYEDDSGKLRSDYRQSQRPPSRQNYLDKLDFEPVADEKGFRLYMSLDNSDYWNQISKEVTITVDEGYEVDKLLKDIEMDDFWGTRWVDFTKFACNPLNQAVSVSVKDIHQRERKVVIPKNYLFSSEVVLASVESVSPVDKIQLWTRNSKRSHCFRGGSVSVRKNGRHLRDTEISWGYSGQYIFNLGDVPGNDCQDIQYDFTIFSKYRVNLGVAKIGKDQNKISLSMKGKVVIVNTLDGFLYCTSRSARLTEVIDSSSQTIHSNLQRQFSLQSFLTPCRESVLELEYQERGRNTMEIVHNPGDIIIDKTSDDTMEVKIGNQDFQNCENTKIELQCENESGIFVSLQNFTTTRFSVKPYLDKTCRIRAWLDQRYLGYAEYITILDPISTLEWILIGVGVGVVVVVLIVISGVCLCRRRRAAPTIRRRERGAGAEMVQLRGSNRIDAE